MPLSAEETLQETLKQKIKTLHDSVWERKADWPLVTEWLEQFSPTQVTQEDYLHALYLLSNFIFFGTNEIRALLRSLYRDIFRSSVIAEIRHHIAAEDRDEVLSQYDIALKKTRFVSLGNPSESSAFLLYYFRQENRLPKDHFIGTGDIFIGDESGSFRVRDEDVDRYVFIDDLCGSGEQGERYSDEIIAPLKSMNPNIKVYYYSLFGTSKGIRRLRGVSWLDSVHTVVELDESFRCFSDESRIYRDVQAPISRDAGHAVARHYGEKLLPADHALGYLHGQLLLGFSHNIPDNTLPIIWYTGSSDQHWTPVFKRHPKLGYY